MKNEILIRYTATNTPRMNLRQCGDWVDIYLPENLRLKRDTYQLIDLGFSAQLPEGYEAHLLPRSSTFGRYGILMGCSQGIIDNAYCGEQDTWKFTAYATRDAEIEVGTRIAQFRIVLSQRATAWQRLRHLFSNGIRLVEVMHLKGKNRGGIGSTGK